MKPDWMERIGYTVWAVGYAVAIVLCIVLIMLVVTGCVHGRTPLRDTPWCFHATSKSGETLRFCAETRASCREAHTYASRYGGKHLDELTRCRQ